MRWPMDVFQLRSGYQFLDWSPSNNSYHPGSDMNRGSGFDDLGDPVYSFKTGVVSHIQYSKRGYGNMVIIKHKKGIYSKYAHLKEIYVSEGEQVNTFEVIGTVGSTGASTASHLHFEIYKNNFSLPLGKNFENYYPVGQSIAWVTKNYHNPETLVKPKVINVTILANKCKWKTWQDKRIELEDWFKEETKGQLELKLTVKHIAVDPVWKHYGKYKGKDMFLLQGDWVNRVLMPKVTGTDICLYVQERDKMEWKWDNINGYASQELRGRDMPYLGIEFIAMRSWEDGSSSRYGKGKVFFGTARHELCHTLIQMYNRHNNRKIKDSGADSIVHKFDYRPKSEVEQSLYDIPFEDLIGWNHPTHVRLFKYRWPRRKEIIHRLIPKDPRFRLVIKGYKRAGFTEYIPKRT